MSSHSSAYAPPPPTLNKILSALSRPDYKRISEHLDQVNLSAGEVLYRPDEPIRHVYFPNRGTVSLISSFEDGGTVAVGMVGNEGMFGVCAFMGTLSTPLEAVVQLSGDALRMRAGALKTEFKRGGELQDLLLRYTQAFITQLAQTSACNRAHPVDGRLASLLLQCRDRAHSEELALTHEHISAMLCVRRAGITSAAVKLREEGLIDYRRGRISVLDRRGLEAESCECYPIMKKEFDRLVGTNGHV